MVHRLHTEPLAAIARADRGAWRGACGPCLVCVCGLDGRRGEVEGEPGGDALLLLLLAGGRGGGGLAAPFQTSDEALVMVVIVSGNAKFDCVPESLTRRRRGWGAEAGAAAVGGATRRSTIAMKFGRHMEIAWLLKGIKMD